MLHIEHLRKTFTVHARELTLVALEGVSLDVEAGAVTALTGPSGAGKSSLLKCIYRSYRPDSGRILFDVGSERVDLATAGDHQVLELRRHHLAFVTQFLHCLPRVPALDVVAEPLIRCGEDRQRARERAGEMLRSLGVPESLWRLSPTTFSGGEKQRVNLARGFVHPGRLLLLDEPTASLDPDTAERVIGQVAEITAGGTAVLCILHDPHLVARLADHAVAITASGHTPVEESACPTP